MSLFSYSGKLMITATFHMLYIVTGEIFTTNLRSVMLGESNIFARIGSSISPFVNTFLVRFFSIKCKKLVTLLSLISVIRNKNDFQCFVCTELFLAPLCFLSHSTTIHKHNGFCSAEILFYCSQILAGFNSRL